MSAAENGATPETAAPGTIERIRPRQLSERDPAGMARAIAESGYWKHIENPAQAMVIMAAGEELGLSPLAAVQGITMIEGNLGYRGNLIATLITQHPHYGYKVIERKDDRCALQFLFDGEPIDDAEEGKVTFTIEDAQRQKLVKPNSNWEKTPRAMCFNRCLTEGGRVYFPDLTAGTPVYTDDEIREVIHVEAEVEVHDDPAPAAPVALDDDTLNRLVQGFELAGPELDGVTPLDGLSILLGSLGIDGFEPGDDDAIRAQFAALSEEQAEEVLAEFDRVLGTEEVTEAEVVAEGDEQPADADEEVAANAR